MGTREIQREARRVIRDAVMHTDWFDTEDYDGNPVETYYLGTVFYLVPSGKYYTPWACSNVTEKEALQDEAWYEAAEEEANKYGCSLENGEGDPCDLFLVRVAE